MCYTGLTMTSKDILQRHFGYVSFRSGQEEFINAILHRRDVLGVMPTGAGKSLCYQVPALILPGCTIVVSPLISLMQDQVSALLDAGVSAACINSTVGAEEYRAVVNAALRGDYKILYVAPERLNHRDICRITDALTISLVVIDEAHCVSQWGHDFRPSYLAVADFIAGIAPRPIVGAFTATATAAVRDDIATQVKLVHPLVLVTGFDRPNLYFEVQHISGGKEKTAALSEYIRGVPGKSGIVYCSTRKAVEQVTSDLTAMGIKATRYHAGLSDAERRENQEDFTFDRFPIMVATNAFGMGIDKSNVSFVVHYNMPKNIEGYYQEAGRAGRDGEKADCILYYSRNDVQTAAFLISKDDDTGTRDSFNSIADDVSPSEVAARADLRRHNMELLKQMIGYCTTDECLRGYLLGYFGETLSTESVHRCGHCSNCLTEFDVVDIGLEARKIISCVYRLEERAWKTRTAPHYGKTILVDILRGAKTEKLLKGGFSRLSTYGIMSTEGSVKIRSILDFLIEKGYLALLGDEYPVVVRTEKSAIVLQGGASFSLEMRIPKKNTHTDARNILHTAAGTALDLGLMERLRELRTALAKETGFPAYIIFSDSALRSMCALKPRNEEEFLKVAGVGNRKLERYGTAFLKEINREPAP